MKYIPFLGHDDCTQPQATVRAPQTNPILAPLQPALPSVFDVPQMIDLPPFLKNVRTPQTDSFLTPPLQPPSLSPSVFDVSHIIEPPTFCKNVRTPQTDLSLTPPLQPPSVFDASRKIEPPAFLKKQPGKQPIIGSGRLEFPHVQEIAQDFFIRAKMELAWALMKRSASPSARYEYGFYICYNHVEKKFYIEEMKKGLPATCGAGKNASVFLGTPSKNLECCAFFHCHTALSYCSGNDEREVGPSEKDHAFAEKCQMPGLLYDYVGHRSRHGTMSTNSTNKNKPSFATVIEAGHDIDDPYELHIFGRFSRRILYI